jgi:hypothetical protein
MVCDGGALERSSGVTREYALQAVSSGDELEEEQVVVAVQILVMDSALDFILSFMTSMGLELVSGSSIVSWTYS